MSATEKLHDSRDRTMKAVITDVGSVAKVEGLVERLSREHESLPQVERSPVTRDSFRGFGINE